MNEFVILLGTAILIACIIPSVMIYINNKRYTSFIASIKSGDIFVYDDKINSYYNLNNLNETDPFSPVRENKLYPSGTIIIRELKYNKNKELWASYDYIEDDEYIKNTDKRLLFHRELNDLIKYRTRIN